MLLNLTKKSSFSSSFTNLNAISLNTNHTECSSLSSPPQSNRTNQTFTSKSFLNANNPVHKTSSYEHTSSDTLPQPDNDSFVYEEQGNDCVYQITIRKVYNKNFSTVDSNNNPFGTYRLINPSEYTEPKNDGLVYSRVKIKQLKYASLTRFIEHLTNSDTGELDSNLVQTFLATFRTFSDAKTVLKQIRTRYEQILPASLEMTEDVRLEHLKSFCLILKMWLQIYPEDFNEPTEYSNLNELNRFACKYLPDSDLTNLIRAKFEQFESNISSCSSSSDTSLNNLNPKLNMSDNLDAVICLKINKSVYTHRRSCSNLGNSSTLVLPNQINLSYSRSQTDLDKDGNKKVTKFNNLFSKQSSTNLETNNIFSIKLEDKFMSIDSNYLAEQLTYLDKCIFQRVCAHQCLGSVWGTRYQKTPKQQQQQQNQNLVTSTHSNTLTPTLSDKFATIRSFIDQFNRVSFIVQSTILDKVDIKPTERGKIIKKWIEVAQACRRFKNFSSLNAIVQGLNTQCVSRLEKTWNEVPSELKQQFNELTEMFSQDQNQKIFRDILMKDLNDYKQLFDSIDSNNLNFNINTIQNNSEGTAKYADINSGINATLSRKMKEKMLKQQYKKQFKGPLGTVPFLGTFLKDLEYINAQNPKNEKGLINVQQKRKEFEIVAQIRLLQQAASLYSIKPDANFEKWLQLQPVYTEVQNYEFSYLVEPKLDRDAIYNNQRKTKLSQGSRSESMESLNIFSLLNSSSNKTPSLKSKSHGKNQNHSRNSSMGSSDLVEGNLKPYDSPQSHLKNSFTNSSSFQNDNQSTNTSNSMEGFTTIPKYGKSISQSSGSSSSEIRVKVNIETFEDPSQSSILYKKMSITDKYRTKDVKKLILQKFFMDANLCDKYILVQILNSNSNDLNNNQPTELIINDNCNVYYAAKNVPDMQFVLRPCGALNSLNSGGSSSNLNSKSLTNSGSNLLYNRSLNSTFHTNQHRSNSLNRNNGLPPQSPNYQQSKSNKHQTGGNLANWKFFKKILS